MELVEEKVDNVYEFMESEIIIFVEVLVGF